MTHATPLQFGIAAFVVLLIMVWRMRRMTRARPLKVEQLWIVPALLILVAALVLWQTQPTLSDAPWLIGAALIGAVIGWYRGKMMRISVDPETHAVSQSASPWAMLVLLGLLAARMAARYALTEEAQPWHISLTVITDAPLMLVVAMFIVARIEMYLRAKRLLTHARTNMSEGPGES